MFLFTAQLKPHPPIWRLFFGVRVVQITSVPIDNIEFFPQSQQKNPHFYEILTLNFRFIFKF
jgi:hypothetical protein